MERSTRTHRVVIVGCGFGGLAAAQALRRAPVWVSVVDRSNHYLFQPLLYQVATAALNPSDIASPIRRILRRQKNAEVLLAEAEAIDLAGRRVVLADGELPFDDLILATGATHAYFGHDDWAPFAPGLKTIPDALEIRKRVLSAFEFAEREADAAEREAWMTFVIVGGGPTGVELAGTLADVSRKTLASDFDHIDPSSARILLIEGASHILSSYAEDVAASARRQLERHGVEVREQQRVTEIDAGGVVVGDERISARTVLWAAGVAASPLARSLGVPLDRAGRVLVNPDLTVPGHDYAYVIGDLAALTRPDGRPVPGIAPAAIQMGQHAAANLLRTLEGRPRTPFHYRDKGQLATIGRGSAVAELGRWSLSGLPAWLMWLFVHIYFLIGFRNRLIVLFEWAWSFVTFDRGARLITGSLAWPHRPPAPPAGGLAEEAGGCVAR
jgi:NADH dehydrogenase